MPSSIVRTDNWPRPAWRFQDIDEHGAPQFEEDGTPSIMALNGSAFVLSISGPGVRLVLTSEDDELDIDTGDNILSWPISQAQAAKFPLGKAASYTIQRIIDGKYQTLVADSFSGSVGPSAGVLSTVLLPGIVGPAGDLTAESQAVLDAAVTSASGSATTATTKAGEASASAIAAAASAVKIANAPTFEVGDGVSFLFGVKESTDPDANWALFVDRETIYHPHMQAHDALFAPMPGFIAADGSYVLLGVRDGDGEDANYGLLIDRDTIYHPHVTAIEAAQEALVERVTILESTTTRVQSTWTPSAWSRALTEWMQIDRLGQSLSIGVGGTSLTTTSLTPLSFAKRFVGGLRARDSGDYSSLVDLIETVANTIYGETGLWGCADTIRRMILAEDGLDLVEDLNRLLIFNASGEGSQPVSALSPGAGTGYYERVEDGITAAAGLAETAVKSYAPGMFAWVHGETDYGLDTPRSTYKAGVEAIRAAIQAHRDTLGGFAGDYPAVCSQLATHRYRNKTIPTIALALLDLAREDEWSLSTPLYFLPRSDEQHLDAIGYKWLGGYEAIAIKRRLFDGVRPQFLDPQQPIRSGRHLILPINGVQGELMWDTTTVAEHPNGAKGFSLVDAADSAVGIAAVEIVGNAVRISADEDIAAGCKVRYAWTGDANIGWGNLRDTQGDTLVVDPEGINKPLHQWLPICEETAL